MTPEKSGTAQVVEEVEARDLPEVIEALTGVKETVLAAQRRLPQEYPELAEGAVVTPTRAAVLHGDLSILVGALDEAIARAWTAATAGGGDAGEKTGDDPGITRLDVAAVLTAPLHEDYPDYETSQNYDWRQPPIRLIRKSAIASALFADLVAEPAAEGGPTLLALAKMLLSLEGKPYRDAYGTALWLVRQSEDGRRIHDELVKAAGDLGYAEDFVDYLKVLSTLEAADAYLAEPQGACDTTWLLIFGGRVARGEDPQGLIGKLKLERVEAEHEPEEGYVACLARQSDPSALIEGLDSGLEGLTAKAKDAPSRKRTSTPGTRNAGTAASTQSPTFENVPPRAPTTSLGAEVTLRDLARIIEAPVLSLDDPGSGFTYIDSLPAALTLIHESSRAREMFERLHEQADGIPSLWQLARLICVFDKKPWEDAKGAAVWLAGESPPGREPYARLRQMAEDAGALPSHGDEACSLLYAFGRHVEAEQYLGMASLSLDPLENEGWDLGWVCGSLPDDWTLNMYGPRIRVVTARLARGEGPADLLRIVLDELISRVQVEHCMPALDAPFAAFRKWALNHKQSDVAVSLLDAILAALRELVSGE